MSAGVFIRKAVVTDVDAITTLFRQTVLVINMRDYSPEQVHAWSKGATAQEKWLRKISTQYFLLAERETELLGFGSITTEGHLDLLYVNKDYQRQGIAQKIYDELESFARGHAVDTIFSDVSITARSFFEKQGFKLIQEQDVKIDDTVLVNYKMEKALG